MKRMVNQIIGALLASVSSSITVSSELTSKSVEIVIEKQQRPSGESLKKTSKTWQQYFLSTNQLSVDSINISEQFNRPIVVLSPHQQQALEAREKLLHTFILPVEKSTDDWWRRYQQGLIYSSSHLGFSVKQPDNLNLPCVVSVGEGYQELVANGGVFNQLTRYNYHPFQNLERDYQEMVLWHEVGHCFETYGGVLGEVYADLFAVLARSQKIPTTQALQQQIRMRRQEFFDGDALHYSSEFLTYLQPAIRSLRLDSMTDMPTLVHLLVADTLRHMKPSARWEKWADWSQDKLAVKYTDILLRKLKHPLSDREEAIYDQLIAVREQLKTDLSSRALAVNQQQATPVYLQQIISDMVYIRASRNDLFNELQVVELRSDVEQLAIALGEPALARSELSNDLWLVSEQKKLSTQQETPRYVTSPEIP